VEPELQSIPPLPAAEQVPDGEQHPDKGPGVGGSSASLGNLGAAAPEKHELKAAPVGEEPLQLVVTDSPDPWEGKARDKAKGLGTVNWELTRLHTGECHRSGCL